MKTKSPICPNCRNVMKVIYTKNSYKLNNKYKTFWSKVGYLCNHVHNPIALITSYNEYVKDKLYKGNYMISIYDYKLFQLNQLNLKTK